MSTWIVYVMLIWSPPFMPIGSTWAHSYSFSLDTTHLKYLHTCLRLVWKEKYAVLNHTETYSKHLEIYFDYTDWRWDISNPTTTTDFFGQLGSLDLTPWPCGRDPSTFRMTAGWSTSSMTETAHLVWSRPLGPFHKVPKWCAKFWGPTHIAT